MRGLRVRCEIGHDCSIGGHSGRTRRRSKVSEVELGVSPLLQERADEALGLALGLRSIGAGGVVPDPQRGTGAPRDVPSLSGSPPGWSGPDRKAGLPLLPEAAQPFVRGGPGGTNTFGGLRRCPAELHYPRHHQQSSVRGQLCPRMGRESLLFSVGAWQPKSEQGGSPFANKVSGHYS